MGVRAIQVNIRAPSLRQLPDGRWMTKWGGRKRYFGRDREAARRLFAASLAEWAAWREHVARARTTRPCVESPLVEHIARSFIEAKERERGSQLQVYYTKHLGRFVRWHSQARADSIRVGDLEALKQDMLQQYAPKTINHDIIAVRALFTWAAEHELIPPVSLRGCRTLALGPPPDKSLTKTQVRTMLRRATPALEPWLVLNYLCAMRPSEVVRVAHGQGDWVEPGIFRLDRGKMDLATSLKRHVVFSDQATWWIERCRPLWSRLDSYSSATVRACGPGGPGVLRHSAATHLAQAGVEAAQIALILGHVPSRVSAIYVRPAWQLLRRSAARLAL